MFKYIYIRKYCTSSKKAYNFLSKIFCLTIKFDSKSFLNITFFNENYYLYNFIRKYTLRQLFQSFLAPFTEFKISASSVHKDIAVFKVNEEVNFPFSNYGCLFMYFSNNVLCSFVIFAPLFFLSTLFIYNMKNYVYIKKVLNVEC